MKIKFRRRFPHRIRNTDFFLVDNIQKAVNRNIFYLYVDKYDNKNNIVFYFLNDLRNFFFTITSIINPVITEHLKEKYSLI